MRRPALIVAALAATAALGFGMGGARADISDNCYDESTDIGVPGPVGVGYDAYHDNTYSANAQHVCYRVYNPLNGSKLAGGVVKPYQYDSSAPTWQSGGVQCIADDSAATKLPFCYIVYGAGVAAGTSGVTAGGYAGGTPAPVIESYGNGIVGIGLPAVTETPDERRVSAATPYVCAGTSQPTGTGGCFGGVTAGVGTAKNDVALHANPSLGGAPTGVDTNRTATPLVSATVAGVPVSRDLPGACVGVC